MNFYWIMYIVSDPNQQGNSQLSPTLMPSSSPTHGGPSTTSPNPITQPFLSWTTWLPLNSSPRDNGGACSGGNSTQLNQASSGGHHRSPSITSTISLDKSKSNKGPTANSTL